ncbi:MAG: hypothetical protein ACRCSL_04725 [Microbacterium sp.]
MLRFRGALTLGADPFGTYPMANAEVPSDVAANVAIGVRFLLADATAPTDVSRRLTNGVFDDSQPAGASPHAPQSVVVANVTTATDQVITSRTWAQNTYVTIQPQTAADAALLVGVEASDAQIVLDGVDSGLGTNTGLPVLILPLVFSAGAQQFAPVNIDMLVEVRHSAVR